MKRFLSIGLLLMLVAPWVVAQDADNADKPQTNVYAIVKTGDGRLQVIRAKEVDKKDPALFITDEEDKKTARQLNMLIDIVPYYVDSDQSLPDENIHNIIAQYDNLIKSYPELKKSLSVDRTKYHAILENRQVQQQQKVQEKEKALKEFTSEQFVDEKEYKLDELNAKLAAAEQFKAQYPDFAQTVDQYVKPWTDRQALLKDGKVLFEGQWRTKQEISQIYEQRREDRLKTFIEQLKPVSISNTVASQQTMTIVVIFLVASALIALFCFYYAVFQSRISGFLEFIMLLVSVIFMGIYAFYVIRVFNAPGLIVEYTAQETKTTPTASEDASLDKLYKLLYISQGDTLKDLKKSDLSVTLENTEINAALDKLVTFRQDTLAGTLGISMEKIRFYAMPTKLRFLQQTSCFGKNFLLRYDLYFQANENVVTFYKCDVAIGDAVLPSAIGNRLWLQLYNSIHEVMRGFNISRNYQIQKIDDGKITVGYVLPGTS